MDTFDSWISLGSIVLGAVLVLVGLSRLRKGLAVRNWPQVRAKILSFDLSWYGSMEGGGSWVPEVKYTYEINGTRYFGERLSHGKTNRSFKDDALICQDRYPVGKDVAAFYNPQKPEDAVLEFGGEGVGAVVVGIGIGLIAGGVLMRLA